MEWEAVIGLEVHLQLATKTKLFSGASTAFGAEPNTQTCAIDLGFPGALPVINAEVVRMAIKLGLGINGEIAKHSIFARKNYFYPDLPKGYQITQHEFPVISNGFLDISLEEGVTKRINIGRAHLEEDAGKSLHEDLPGLSGIDLNRAGTPLLEVVTHPDIRSAKEAVAYLKKLHSLVRYLEICDGNMQEGSFRCDANVSVRPLGGEKLGTRTELKNLNSFRFIERAINHEIERQIFSLEGGNSILQETRLYDPDKNETRPMRSKEEEHDYRYFPDPDLLPLIISEELIKSVKQTLPELPQQKIQRFIQNYNLSPYDVGLLVSSRAFADYFEEVVKHSGGQAKLAVNWVMGDLSAFLNEVGTDIQQSPVSAEQLGTLIARIADHTISGKIAKTIFTRLWNQEGTVDQVIEQQGLRQVSDTASIEALIDKIFANCPAHVADYKAGKEKLFGFFVGKVMQESGGKINPQVLNNLLKKKLATS